MSSYLEYRKSILKYLKIKSNIKYPKINLGEITVWNEIDIVIIYFVCKNDFSYIFFLPLHGNDLIATPVNCTQNGSFLLYSFPLTKSADITFASAVSFVPTKIAFITLVIFDALPKS